MQFKLQPKQIAILAGAGVLLITVIVLILSNLRPEQRSTAVTLTVWGTEPKEAFDGLIKPYQEARQNVQVRYRQLDEATYDDQLLDALAAGEGPDIFMIGNRSLPRQLSRLVAVSSTQLLYTTFQERFPTVVEQDFMSGGRIYALPLYLDTLALFYNRDHFDRAGIVAPPKTWKEVQDMVPLLRLTDSEGRITRAAIALGGSERSVRWAPDIVQMFLMQNGAPMVDPRRTAANFASGDEGRGSAFDSYLQFANAGSPLYTWSDRELSSLDAFAAGKVSMMVGYRSDLQRIKEKSPFLSVGVAPIPQPEGREEQPITFARYVGLAVWKQSKAAGWAWDFIMSVTMNPGILPAYLGSGERTSALRSLISHDLNTPVAGVFARQTLTARSWYQGDDRKVRQIFNSAISAVLTGQETSGAALDEAQSAVTRILRSEFTD